MLHFYKPLTAPRSYGKSISKRLDSYKSASQIRVIGVIRIPNPRHPRYKSPTRRGRRAVSQKNPSSFLASLAACFIGVNLPVGSW